VTAVAIAETAGVSRALEPAGTVWTGGHNPWVIALVVTMATFMEILDTSVANVSLPHMAGNLDVARSEATWVLTSYLIANAVVLPVSGWLSDTFGRKRFYMTCVVLFTAASALCGMAPTLGWLVFFRVLQGAAGGGLGPSEQAILVDTFSPAKRGMAMALYGMTVVLAPAIGPTLGGFITDHWSWRWMFFINVPIGILSVMMSAHVLSDPPYMRDRAKTCRAIDWQGLALVAVGLGFLEIVLDRGPEEGWFDSPFIVQSMVVAVIALPAFVIWEWRHQSPIVDVRMFAQRSFAVASALAFGLGFAAYSSTVILPNYLQVLMGYSAQQAGMVLSPGGLTIFLIIPIASQLVSRMDPRVLVAIGFASTAAALLWTARTIDAQMDFATALRMRCIQCAGMGLLFVPIQTIAYTVAPGHKVNQVSGIMNLSRNIGADIGISFLVAIIYRQRQLHQTHLVAHATPYDTPYRARLEGIGHALVLSGTTAVEAVGHAKRIAYNEIVTRAMELAYLDAIYAIGAVTAVLVPLVLLAQRWRSKPARGRVDGREPTTFVRPAPDGEKTPSAGRRRAWLVAAMVVPFSAAIAAYWSLRAGHESTDDAQVDGNISQVGARVSGVVRVVHVEENQRVERGDVLAEIDTTDLAIAAGEARARVAEAEAQLDAETPSVPSTQTSNAASLGAIRSDLERGQAALSAAGKEVEQLAAEIKRAEANGKTAEREKERADRLFASGAVPRADFDLRIDTATAARAAVEALLLALSAAQDRVAQRRAEVEGLRSRFVEVLSNGPLAVATRVASVSLRKAALDLSQAQLVQAEQNLAYATVRAPIAGIVAKRSMAVGNHVEPGQPLVALAEAGSIWVTANYRETQLRHMYPDQLASIYVDALGATLRGVVESIGGATGSRVSELPPENATGNYVKVVQRIPVRIRLDPGQPGLERLRVGMSVEPDVTVR
jgi:DHA2 family multidrug resistance protein